MTHRCPIYSLICLTDLLNIRLMNFCEFTETLEIFPSVSLLSPTVTSPSKQDKVIYSWAKSPLRHEFALDKYVNYSS